MYESILSDLILSAETADVIILTATGWHAYGRTQAAHYPNEITMPVVSCPVVDITLVDGYYDRNVAEAISQYRKTNDLPALLDALKSLGATIAEEIEAFPF